MERPEHRLLLACARVCSDSERKELILSSLGGQIDWEYLLQTAGSHGMTSLLFWHLKATCQDNVPKAILGRPQIEFLKSARRKLLFTEELVRILDLFKKNNIPAIPFKGPVLALTLYEDIVLREFGDLDILVHSRTFSGHSGCYRRTATRRYLTIHPM